MRTRTVTQSLVHATSPILALVAAIGLLHSQTAAAASFNVATPQELQTALSQAAANGDNDTINLAAGYYVGNFNFNSSEPNSLTIQAAAGVTNSAITIDGDGNGGELIITADAEVDVTILGMTFKRNCGSVDKEAVKISTLGDVLIRNSRFLASGAAQGRGIYLPACRGLTIDQNIVTCTGEAQGEGIHCDSASAVVSYTKNVVSANTRRGIYHSGGTLITFRENEMNDNSVQDNDYHGYALWCKGNATLEDNTILRTSRIVGNGHRVLYIEGNAVLRRNTVSDSTGVYGAVIQITGTGTLSENTITRNSTQSASYEAVQIAGSATVTDNVITHNEGRGLDVGGTSTITGNTITDNNAGDYYGGGIRVRATATIRGNTIADNSCVRYGGGVYADNTSATFTFTSNSITGNRTTYSADGGGGGVNVNGTAVFEDNVISGNTSARHGGGVYDNRSDRSSVYRRNIIANNGATLNGGGLYIIKQSVTFINNRVTGCSAGSAGGGGRFQINEALTMVNNTFSDSTSVGNGGGLLLVIDGTDEEAKVYNNIIWGNRSTGGDGDDLALSGAGARKELYHNDVNGLYGVWDFAVGNVDIAPLFVDALAGDYHLRNGSPIADAALGSAPMQPLVDLDWNTRDTNTVDIGCYELANIAPHPADANSDWTLTEAEYNAYRAAWLADTAWATAPTTIPVDFVTRAGYLVEQGETYHNDAGAKPVCWKPGL